MNYSRLHPLPAGLTLLLLKAVKTEPMPSGGFQPALNRLPEYCMQEAV
ncbi:hypothetical protein [Neisseria animaloris]|nr:hypothetical protein [Neisseria animaloris]